MQTQGETKSNIKSAQESIKMHMVPEIPQFPNKWVNYSDTVGNSGSREDPKHREQWRKGKRKRKWPSS